MKLIALLNAPVTAEIAPPKIEPSPENIPDTAPAPEESPARATLRPASATTRNPP